LADLADLVENRAPTALQARLDDDDTAIDRFDFARADYRVLIALREDYLAHLEGLKPLMPSITQNRMRLARMTGTQAFAAVIEPRRLRVEERLDVGRVELTHDVLTGVVKASRDLRLERQARDDIERKLAEQRAREDATRRALSRTRRIAAGCAVLAVVAIAS